jgi:hypothetical protein
MRMKVPKALERKLQYLLRGSGDLKRVAGTRGPIYQRVFR